MEQHTPISQIEVLQEVKKNELTQAYEKRLARLERYVAKVDSVMKDLETQVAEGTFEAFSEEQIRVQLTCLPNLIADAGILLAKIQRAYSYAKNDTKSIWSQYWVDCNKRKESLGLSSAEDRKSWVEIQPDVRQARNQESEWQYNVARAQVIYDRYVNLFASCRKLANLIPTYNKAQDDYLKYNMPEEQK